MKPRILIVDDEPALLKLLARRLELEGFEVAAAESGERALALLAAAQPQLVVSDLKMGGMDGMTLFATIQIRCWCVLVSWMSCSTPAKVMLSKE